MTHELSIHTLNGSEEGEPEHTHQWWERPLLRYRYLGTVIGTLSARGLIREQ